jgi:mannose-1-phosphate guanylyltransferase
LAVDKAVLLKDSKVVNIFKKLGWQWGGDWRCIKDYQHFDKNKKADKVIKKSISPKILDTTQESMF